MEIVLTHDREEEEEEEGEATENNPSRKGGFSTTRRVHARLHGVRYACARVVVCTHEATRGCRVSCFIGHLRRVRPYIVSARERNARWKELAKIVASHREQEEEGKDINSWRKKSRRILRDTELARTCREIIATG